MAIFKNKKIAIITILVLFVANFLFIYRFMAKAAEDKYSTPYLELNDEIKNKKSEIEELTQKRDQYKSNIRAKQQEAVNLENQIVILDSEIAETSLEIESSQKEIETLNLEIQLLSMQIKEKSAKIKHNKEILSNLIREINRNDQKSYLEITFQNDNFSDFFTQIRYLEDIQTENKDALKEIKTLKEELEASRGELKDKKKEEENKKDGLEQING